MKFLKNEIKKWRASDYPKEVKELHDTKKRVYDIDLAAEERELTESEIAERRATFQRILELEKLAVLDIKQRAKIKWIIDGDENTAFFHRFVNNKRRKSKISGLLIDGVWVTEPEAIKSGIFSFYQEKFQERWASRPKFSSSKFSSIDPTTRDSLESPFTIEEIKEAIWACGNEKALGPDGYTFKFIKRYWDI